MATDDSICIARFLPPLVSLDRLETNLVTPMFKSEDLKKGQFFLHRGEEVSKVAIVDKGILSRYSGHEKDQKHIDQFLYDNQYFSDHDGYILRQTSVTNIQASSTNIQALTFCHLWTIEIDQVETLKKTSHHLALIAGSITDIAWCQDRKLTNMLRIKDPLQRLQCFYELYAHCFSDIPVGDIQIYLNISHTHYYELLPKLLKNVRFRT